MKYSHTFNQNPNASLIWKKHGLFQWVQNIFNVPSIKMGRKCTKAIHEHIREELIKEGWAMKVKIEQTHGLDVYALHDSLKLVIQVQVGNVSRMIYDLIKLQYLYINNRIVSAVVAVPTVATAKVIGDNIANAERLERELKLFDKIITVPILVVAFK